jgi:hypothetical protein
MLTLVTSHNIALSKEQRYKLHAGESVTAIGISIPVWFQKGNTSEPAQEVFATYKISNDSGDFQIKTNDQGYEINLPQPNPEMQKYLENIDQDILDTLGIQREMPTSKKLLDFEDGGNAGMYFRQFAKSNLVIDGEKTKIPLSIIHSVEIHSLDDLLDTLS